MMQVKNYLLTLLTIPLISGCWFSPEPKVVVQTKMVEKNIPIVEHPKSPKLTKIKFYVVTEETYGKFKSDFSVKNNDFVYVAMSVKDYENLSLNMGELRRFINQQKEIIVYYEKIAKPDNNTTNK